MSEIFELVVIGGGPVGLYANQYALKKGMNTILIESLPTLGGQLIHLYPENPVHYVGGMKIWKAKNLVNSIVSQTEKYNPTYYLKERVLEIERKDLSFEIISSKDKYYTKTVLIATGPGIYIPESLAGLSETEKIKAGMITELAKNEDVLGKDVVVVGGSQETVGWALQAAQYARKVLLINWRFIESFSALQASATVPKTVNLMEPFEILEIIGDTKVTGIKIFHAQTGIEQIVDTDVFLMARGHLTNLNDIKHFGVKMEWNGIKVNETMHTSVPGVFAAGDIVYYKNKERLISTGSIEAATAIESIEAYLKAVYGNLDRVNKNQNT